MRYFRGLMFLWLAPIRTSMRGTDAYLRVQSSSTVGQTEIHEVSQSIRDEKLYCGRPKGNIGDQTIASALAALRAAAQSNDRMVRAEASRVAAHSCNVAEEYEQSLEHYERAIELFEGSGAGEQAARTRLGYMAALFTTGRYEKAL